MYLRHEMGSTGQSNTFYHTHMYIVYRGKKRIYVWEQISEHELRLNSVGTIGFEGNYTMAANPISK